MRTTLLAALVLCLAGLFGSGCIFGNDCDHGYDLEGTRTMVVGSSQELSAVEALGECSAEDVSIESAQSSNPDVVEISETKSHALAIQAKSTGEATISAQMSKEKYAPELDLRIVDKPTSVKFERAGWCGDREPVVSNAPFAVRLTPEYEGSNLVVSDPMQYVDVAPMSAAELMGRSKADREGFDAWFRPTSAASGELTLQSTVSQNTIAYEVASREQIDALKVLHIGEGWTRFADGETRKDRSNINDSREIYDRTQFVPTVGEREVCGEFQPKVRNQTPDACSVDFLSPDEGTRSSSEHQQIRVNHENDATFVRPGSEEDKRARCEFSLVFEQANAGAGLSVRFLYVGPK